MPKISPLMSIDNEEIHFGKLIKKKMKKDGRKVTRLAEILNCHPKAIYDIYKRPDINTAKLIKICIYLNHNLFENVVAKEIKNDDNYELTAKLIDLSLVTDEFHIGKLIQIHLDNNGQTQIGLAKKLHETNSAVSKICKNPDINTFLLPEISKYLKLNLFIYYFVYVKKLLKEENY